MKITLPVTFDSAGRRKDRSVGLRFTTTLEVSSEDYLQLDQLTQQEGWLLFSPNELDLSDIPTAEAPSDLKKPSQRLKAVLYLLYRETDTAEDFDTYYRRQMDKIIETIKDRLP